MGTGRHGPGNNLFLFFDDLDGNHIELSAEMERFFDDSADYAPRIWKRRSQHRQPVGRPGAQLAQRARASRRHEIRILPHAGRTFAAAILDGARGALAGIAGTGSSDPELGPCRPAA